MPYPKAGWTYDDLRATAKALTKDTNGDGKIDQFGYVIDPWDFEAGMSEIIWAYGGDLVSADHTKTLLGDPNARQAFQFLHDMMFIDKSIPDPNTSSQYGGDLFLSGNAAMIAMGHWSVPGYSQAKFKWDVVPMPKGPAGQATSVNSAGFVVAKDSKNPQAAFAFIKFVLEHRRPDPPGANGICLPGAEVGRRERCIPEAEHPHQPADLPRRAGLCPHEAGLQRLR